jgi:putative membrane protein
MKYLVSLLLNSVAVVVASYLLPNVTIDSYQTALMVALFIGLLNVFVKPVLKILTLPINVLTLGLFSLVVNGVLVLLVSNFLPGFNVEGLIWAIIFSIVLSIVSSVLSLFSK